jgi:hypothetical protein
MSKTNNLTPFTFDSSGESCFIRPVPSLLIREVEQSIPRPEPPAQEVEGPDGTKRMERNTAHPDYVAALAARRDRVQEAMTKLVIKRGVRVTLTDEQRAEVRQLREEMQADFDLALAGTDEELWVKYIAASDPQDIARLINAVAARSVPSDPKSQAGLTSSPSPSEATTSSESQPAEAG